MSSSTFLPIQKKLLHIIVTSEFAIRNISNTEIRNNVVEDLYFLLQDLSTLVNNAQYETSPKSRD